MEKVKLKYVLEVNANSAISYAGNAYLLVFQFQNNRQCSLSFSVYRNSSPYSLPALHLCTSSRVLVWMPLCRN